MVFFTCLVFDDGGDVDVHGKSIHQESFPLAYDYHRDSSSDYDPNEDNNMVMKQ